MGKPAQRHGAEDPSADILFEAIHRLMHRYRARQYRELRELPQNLTHMEFRALSFFSRTPGATLSDLVQHSGRDKAQLARLVKSLREAGLLEAFSDEGDKRNVCLRLSAAGKTIHKHIHKRGAELSRLAMKGLEQDERQTLLSLLDKVQANLDAEDGDA